MFQSTVRRSINSTLSKYTKSFLSLLFLCFATSAPNNNSAVDFIILFLLLSTEKSSYTQDSFLLIMVCLLTDSVIFTLPRITGISSICSIYALPKPRFNCCEIPAISISVMRSAVLENFSVDISL